MTTTAPSGATTTTGTAVAGVAAGAGDRAASEARLHAVLASGSRPKRPGPLASSLVYGWRTLLKIKYVPEQLFDVTAFPVMLTLIFTFLFGGALAGSVDEYLQFFLPGILVQSVVMITMYTGVSLNTDITKGVFDRFRSLPVWRPSAMVGALLGDAVRFTLASVVVIGLGLLLGFRPDAGPVGVVAAVLLLLAFAFSLSWVWTFFGLVLRTPNSVMGVSMMVITPLTFGSNIFVDPSTMPGWLQAFVSVNPVSHLVTAVRGLVHGTGDAGQVLLVLASCVVLVAVFAPLTMHRYRTRE